MSATRWKGPTARFLTAQTISLLGSSLVQYAIVWYITLSTSSGLMLTFSTLCGFLPQVFISLFAGVWIDRYSRKKMVMLSDSVIAAATLVLAVLFLTGHRDVRLLFVVLAIRSAGTGVQTPCVNALLPQLVPKEHLMRVNGINSTLSSLIMFLSPALSGAILSVATIEATFFIDVVTAVLGVGITATIAIPMHQVARNLGKSSLEDIKAGFSYLRRSPFVRRLLLFQITVLFLISPSAFLTPLMVSRSFGAEVWRLTASEMSYSLGMVAGGALIAAWGGFRDRMKTTALAGAVYGAIMVAMGLAPFFWVYLAFNCLIGITAPCYNAPITVLLQERVEPEMQGRVFSLMQISTSCALPLGMVLFGPLADLLRVQTLLMLCGGVVVLVSLRQAFLRRTA